mgnify:CR=1 FL=1
MFCRRFNWDQIVARFVGLDVIAVACLHTCLHFCALAHVCSGQASASKRLGLAMNTLPSDAPGGEGDLTPPARLVYMEMRREYVRVRDD